MAASGRSVGPSLYHMLTILGKDKVLAPLRAAAGMRIAATERAVGNAVPREVYTVADLRDWPAATGGRGAAVAAGGVRRSGGAFGVAADAQRRAGGGGIDARYTRLHVRPEELAEALRLAARRGFHRRQSDDPAQGRGAAAARRRGRSRRRCWAW